MIISHTVEIDMFNEKMLRYLRGRGSISMEKIPFQYVIPFEKWKNWEMLYNVILNIPCITSTEDILIKTKNDLVTNWVVTPDVSVMSFMYKASK